MSAARTEVLQSRLSAGLTQDEVGAAMRMSGSRVGRFERGELDDVGIAQLCRIAAAVGLTMSLRFFPDIDPIRDAAQIRLLTRFRAILPAGIGWRTEVPLLGSRDLRAWDGVAQTVGCLDGVEAETRLRDIQALQRRLALKQRDDPSIGHLVLIVAETRGNRRALTAARESLLSQFPVTPRMAIPALRSGRCPGGNTLLVL